MNELFFGLNRQVSSSVDEMSIAFLENSIYFFIKCAFIKQERNGCRLIVTHHEHLLLDQLYATAKGAKIAFVKRYGHRLWQEGVQPIWISPPRQIASSNDAF